MMEQLMLLKIFYNHIQHSEHRKKKFGSNPVSTKAIKRFPDVFR